MGLPIGGRGLGIGGFLLLLVLSLVFKTDFFELVGGGGQVSSPDPGAPAAGNPDEEKLVQFVSFVLDDVQNVWERQLGAQGARYERAKLVLFTDSVSSGCGYAGAAMGPFYCPLDQKAYIDLGFYRELERRFGAQGDFAQAYVLAHEIGHHVQHQLGLDRELRASGRSNEASVRFELQADCLAGIWSRSTDQRGLLEPDDVEEAMTAAAAVGDDRIQRQATGRVNPESWTHGSAQERVSWFRRGLESGRLADCDTSSVR